MVVVLVNDFRTLVVSLVGAEVWLQGVGGQQVEPGERVVPLQGTMVIYLTCTSYSSHGYS